MGLSGLYGEDPYGTAAGPAVVPDGCRGFVGLELFELPAVAPVDDPGERLGGGVSAMGDVGAESVPDGPKSRRSMPVIIEGPSALVLVFRGGLLVVLEGVAVLGDGPFAGSGTRENRLQRVRGLQLRLRGKPTRRDRSH